MVCHIQDRRTEKEIALHADSIQQPPMLHMHVPTNQPTNQNTNQPSLFPRTFVPRTPRRPRDEHQHSRLSPGRVAVVEAADGRTQKAVGRVWCLVVWYDVMGRVWGSIVRVSGVGTCGGEGRTAIRTLCVPHISLYTHSLHTHIRTHTCTHAFVIHTLITTRADLLLGRKAEGAVRHCHNNQQIGKERKGCA